MKKPPQRAEPRRAIEISAAERFWASDVDVAQSGRDDSRATGKRRGARLREDGSRPHDHGLQRTSRVHVRRKLVPLVGPIAPRDLVHR